MKRFDRLSIREKLVRIIVMITTAVLLPAAALSVVVDYFLLHQTTARNVRVLADAMAYTSSAALAFDDPEEAAAILSAFRADPNVDSAVLYDMDRQVFATFPPARHMEGKANDRDPFPDTLAERTVVFESGRLRYLLRVGEEEAQLGWLLIHYDLHAARERLLLFFAITLLITAVALLIAYILSLTFESRISGPILALENVARRVSKHHDYSVRAEQQTGDEIGSLTQTFNIMLEQIAAKEQALRASEHRLRVAVEASRVGVWEWNLDSDEATWIGSLYESIGLEKEAESSTAESFFTHILPKDRPHVDERIRQAVQTNGSFEADFRVSTHTGEILYILARGRSLASDGTPDTRMVGVIIDVTDLRRAQAEILDLNRNLEKRVDERTLELRRALDEIEAFNYSVSHDLRTPLRGIAGFSRVLLEDYYDQLDSTGRDFLERIVASCRRMGQLIDDLLKLSRITQQEMRKETVDLSVIAHDIVKTLRETDPHRQVAIRIEKALLTEGDRRLLAVVLENLLQNAWKFTSHKEDARIEVGCEIQDGRKVFFVRDNGAGFDMAFAGNLFGVFERLHKRDEFEGTGIGLATVRRIVERHGGEIWATGEVDRGATFYFTLAGPADEA